MLPRKVRMRNEFTAIYERDGDLEGLIGTLGDAPDVPADLSERHDSYLAQALEREQQ